MRSAGAYRCLGKGELTGGGGVVSLRPEKANTKQESGTVSPWCLSCKHRDKLSGVLTSEGRAA